jgi:hypothetical protein
MLATEGTEGTEGTDDFSVPSVPSVAIYPHENRCKALWFLFLPAFFKSLLGLFVSPAFDLAQFDR